MMRSYCSSRVGPKSNGRCPYKEKASWRHTDTEREEGHMLIKAVIGKIKLQAGGL